MILKRERLKLEKMIDVVIKERTIRRGSEREMKKRRR